MEQEYLQKRALGKERAFLFISILIILTFLTGSPESIVVFFSGTYEALTGAAVATDTADTKDYLEGFAIFVALVAISFYVVHVLRHPKPQLWRAELPEEEGELSVLEESELDQKLDRINKEIVCLRKKEEFLPPSRIRKRLTKIPNIKEETLSSELRKVTARLHGYRKPVVLEKPQKKTRWDEDLKKVTSQITSVNKMKIKKAKIREVAPAVSEIAMHFEKKKLGRELEKITSLLKKGQKNPSYFIRSYIPSMRERELKLIRKRLQKKGHMPEKELKEIEAKLAELKKNS
ncbi:MAG: hypothetical protein AABW53_02230 [Nanoarchaeota archaeon]|mgnify:FL=1